MRSVSFLIIFPLFFSLGGGSILSSSLLAQENSSQFYSAKNNFELRENFLRQEDCFKSQTLEDLLSLEKQDHDKSDSSKNKAFESVDLEQKPSFENLLDVSLAENDFRHLLGKDFFSGPLGVLQNLKDTLAKTRRISYLDLSYSPYWSDLENNFSDLGLLIKIIAQDSLPLTEPYQLYFCHEPPEDLEKYNVILPGCEICFQGEDLNKKTDKHLPSGSNASHVNKKINKKANNLDKKMNKNINKTKRGHFYVDNELFWHNLLQITHYPTLVTFSSDHIVIEPIDTSRSDCGISSH